MMCSAALFVDIYKAIDTEIVTSIGNNAIGIIWSITKHENPSNLLIFRSQSTPHDRLSILISVCGATFGHYTMKDFAGAHPKYRHMASTPLLCSRFSLWRGFLASQCAGTFHIINIISFLSFLLGHLWRVRQSEKTLRWQNCAGVWKLYNVSYWGLEFLFENIAHDPGFLHVEESVELVRNVIILVWFMWGFEVYNS